jgi:hypothetical protein
MKVPAVYSPPTTRVAAALRRARPNALAQDVAVSLSPLQVLPNSTPTRAVPATALEILKRYPSQSPDRTSESYRSVLASR